MRGTRARIVFLSTAGRHAPKVLRALCEHHDVVGVASPNPELRREAARRGIPFYEVPAEGPAKGFVKFLADAKADLGVVFMFERMLGPKQLATAQHFLNVHSGGRLRYGKLRGVYPFLPLIASGARTAWLNIHRVVPNAEEDSGAVAHESRFELKPGGNVSDFVASTRDAAARVLPRVISEVISGRARWTEQDHSKATLVTRENARKFLNIHWGLPVETLRRRFNAGECVVHQLTYSFIGQTPYMVKLLEIQRGLTSAHKNLENGQVVENHGRGVVTVKARDGLLRVKLQPVGDSKTPIKKGLVLRRKKN